MDLVKFKRELLILMDHSVDGNFSLNILCNYLKKIKIYNHRCTPGMVMNMYGLLLNNPKPTKQLIENSFDGNICRCTGTYFEV